MTRHGREALKCRCGRETRNPFIVRGLKLCAECAFDEEPTGPAASDMQRWARAEWSVRPITVKRIG